MPTLRIVVPPLLTHLSSLYPSLVVKQSRVSPPRRISYSRLRLGVQRVVLIDDPAKSSAEIVTYLHNGLLPCDLPSSVQ